MHSGEKTVSLPLPIKENPHWSVIIRPDIFEPEHIPTLKGCWSLIESCRVSLRGWDYPHVDSKNRINGTDWIASWCEFRNHREYWRFYQSGQFVHLFSFNEDEERERAEQRARLEINIPKNFSPSGYLSIINTLYTITEIFEFATRLAQKETFGNSVSIVIELNKVKDRILFVWSPSRMFDLFCLAVEDVLTKKWDIKTQELVTNSAELARKTVVWFFERFQWMDPSPKLLSNEQQKFLERRI